MSEQSELQPMAQASVADTLRVTSTIVVPTISKGIIRRRAPVQGLAQHQELDTQAIELLKDLRRKYGNAPLLIPIPLRPQVLIFDAKDVAQALSQTPEPFSTSTMEKQSVLAHLEPGHILIASPEQRAKLRPLHEQALATDDRIHPFAQRFKNVIDGEVQDLLAKTISDRAEALLSYDDFVPTWMRIVRRVVLGDAARDDEDLTKDMDSVRQRANWGFLAPTDTAHLDSFHGRLARYIENPEEASLVHRLPKSTGADLESQVAHWMFAFDPAGIVTFRALALLGCQPNQQDTAAREATSSDFIHPFTRAVVLDAVRLWPTTPAILRELTEDSVIGGHRVAKGTSVVIYVPYFHRDELLPSAHQMSPETWIDNKDDKVMSRGFVPFSTGPAMCPGHNLVPLISSLFIACLLAKMRISLAQPSLDPKALPGTLNHTEAKLNISKRGTAPS
ncbi:hypothetical protein S40288_11718 [Stachybotrys chartarum IBT 40288]|nr:hypothetical protein S40288_11718 [Stachybotrys chartarum IBT 40288]